MTDALQAGMTFEFRYAVPQERTVPHLFPDIEEAAKMPHVFATGYMVGLIEWACIQAINPHIDWPNEQTVGININVNRSPNDGYWTDVWMNKPIGMCYWRGRPTEDWIFSQIYAAGADWNETKWGNERFNMLLVEARGELDPAKRRELYVEMQRLVHDDGRAACRPAFPNVFSVPTAPPLKRMFTTALISTDRPALGGPWSQAG